MSVQVSSLKLEEHVHQFIQARDLLRSGDRVVVAVSGGPDSVALLACLVALSSRWNLQINIGHVNHGLRGMESDKDAAFVEQLGSHFGVPVTIRKITLKKEDAKLAKQSLQAYARLIRYQALESILQEHCATKIATGHTANDQAETVLMWMLRGSGTGGLSGIPPKRGEKIVRPLLDLPRKKIVEYLDKRELSYRMDSSNRQPVYLRNRLRQELMPQLKFFSPGIVNVLSRQAEMIRDDHEYLENVAVQAFRQICVNRDEREIQLERSALLAVPMAIRRRVVRHSLQHVSGELEGPRFDAIQCLLDRLEHGQSGWVIPIDTVDVCQEYDRLIFSKRRRIFFDELSSSSLKDIEVGMPGEVTWPLTGQRLAITVKHAQEITTHQNSCETHLDAATFTPELRIRSWKPGDVFCPKGLGGHQKKLQDFFSDIKLPRSQRERVPLLVAPEGILWIGGLRGDERFQVSSATISVVIASMDSGYELKHA